jgi:hypothetical protein
MSRKASKYLTKAKKWVDKNPVRAALTAMGATVLSLKALEVAYPLTKYKIIEQIDNLKSKIGWERNIQEN